MAVGFPVFLVDHQSHAIRVSTQLKADLVGKMGELPIVHRFGWIESNMPQAIANVFASRFLHPIF
ncbi:hypothetical protein Amal_03335 [Acetobacter malorum]|uniref:Uncharacterized protein n=1 Tax=Acetobacter malorum TaxID=178901 RepID=A0A177G6N0_9PROT|nr:hypothetical protein Amal_03335 [Acetobacter malorum]